MALTREPACDLQAERIGKRHYLADGVGEPCPEQERVVALSTSFAARNHLRRAALKRRVRPSGRRKSRSLSAPRGSSTQARARYALVCSQLATNSSLGT